MRLSSLLLILLFLSTTSLFAQGVLKGVVYLQNSKHTPVAGLQIQDKERLSNGDYSKQQGEFTLQFPQTAIGKAISLQLGEVNKKITDAKGAELEWVNEPDFSYLTVAKDPQEKPLKIIVCPKGARDLAAQKYYKIIKTSSDIELSSIKKEFNQLLNQKEKDYKKIAESGELIEKLQKQVDSLSILKEAYNIASINKDDAGQRVLRYLQLLEEGKSIQEAREVLNKDEAKNDLRKSEKLAENAVNELTSLAKASINIFDYRDAIECYETIVAHYEIGKKDPLLIAEACSLTGILYEYIGEYKKAEEYLLKALASREKVLEPNHPDIDISLSKLGILYHNMGEYKKAEKYYLKVLASREKVLEPNHPDIATSLHSLGILYHNMGDYKKAEEYLLKVLAIRGKVLEPNHLDIATSLHSLGALYNHMCEYKKAEEYYLKALAIMGKKLDPNHPDIASSFNSLGILYHNMGEHKKAEEYYLKALAMMGKKLESNHPNIATSLRNLGGLYKNMGEYTKAEECYLKALAMMGKKLDPNHPDIARVNNQLGNIYFSSKQYENAIKFLLKVNQLNPNFELLNKVGLSYYRIANYPEALNHYTQAATLSEEYAKTIFYNNIGMAHAKNNQFSEAKDTFEKYQQVYPKEGRTYRNWAMYYALQNEKEKAFEELEKAIQLGYSDIDFLENDDSLASLRNEPRFQTLLQQVKQKVANEKK